MGQPNTDPATPPATPPADPPKQGEPATQPPKPADPGPAGGVDALRADLAKERDERQKLQKQLESLAPLGQLAQALGVKPDQGKTDVQTLTEQVSTMQKQMRDAELRAIRAEVAAEKKLPPALASRLQGSSREELVADADALAALIPAGTGAAGAPGTPAPDLSQGARGGVDALAAQLKAAQEKGDTRESIRLKTLIAASKRK